MKNILLLLVASLLVQISFADNAPVSTSDAGLVNNSDLNRKMASSKQFHRKKRGTAVITEEEVQNNSTVNLKSASNKLF